MSLLAAIRSTLGFKSPARPAYEDDFQKGRKYFAKEDYATAAAFFLQAAEHGHAMAQYNLGAMYLAGQGVEQDYRPAAYWFQEAAEQGVSQAQHNMGVMYAGGLGVTQDNGHASYWYHKAAEQGIAQAQSVLSEMYGKGLGVQQDLEQAAYWQEKAAKQDVAPAQFKSESLSEESIGARPNDEPPQVPSSGTTATPREPAVDIDFGVDLSPDANSPESPAPADDFEAGMKSYNDRDYALAAGAFLRAAAQGNARSQFMLAEMYRQGQSFAQSHEQAASWFRHAAEQGLADAQFNLGILYRTGQGVAPDWNEAVSWYRKAAAQQHVDAQLSLGLMFMHPQEQGVAPDYVEAHKWFSLAAANGSENAKKNRDAVEQKLSREQIAEAQRRAGESLKTH